MARDGAPKAHIEHVPLGPLLEHRLAGLVLVQHEVSRKHGNLWAAHGQVQISVFQDPSSDPLTIFIASSVCVDSKRELYRAQVIHHGRIDRLGDRKCQVVPRLLSLIISQVLCII